VRSILFLFIFCCGTIAVTAQADTSRKKLPTLSDSIIALIPGPDIVPERSLDHKRLKLVISSEAALGISSIISLNSVWYKDYPRTSFHFFDDSREWLQVDKAGHVLTSYYIGRIGTGLLLWCGVKPKQAAWYGGSLGFIYQSGLEMLDGFSSGWGFSWSDVAANALGSAACISQQLFFHGQRFTFKVSDHSTSFAAVRPELLGNTGAERMFKDYNGQTYWLSMNISSVFNCRNNFPKWLDLSVGYGAEGMIGGSYNPVYDKNGNAYPRFERYRQFYFSLDADLWRIKNLPRFLQVFTRTFGFIKIPFPALEFSKDGVKGYYLYF
jgi:hypothetical protein